METFDYTVYIDDDASEEECDSELRRINALVEVDTAVFSGTTKHIIHVIAYTDIKNRLLSGLYVNEVFQEQ